MPPRAATLPLLIPQGDWAEARQLAVITRTHGSPVERQLAVTLLGVLARHQGDVRLAWEAVHEMLHEGPSTEPGGSLFPCAVELQRLAVELALDATDLSTARSWLEAHDRWLTWSGSVRGQADRHLLWAEYHRVGGDGARAYEHATTALELATTPRQPLRLLASHRLLGRLDAAAGRIPSAESHLEVALAMANACAAPYERVLVLLALAELYLRTRRIEQARTLLDEARDTCTVLGAAPALARVAALQADLATRAAPTGYPANLSSREVEVLRLVAEGLTDAEVAERLFISVRTVGQHLRSIYNKLGVSSRTAAARFAVQHDLV